jgi:hypothetical protein
MRRAGLPAVVALLASLGMGRIAYTHFLRETAGLRTEPRPPLDRRYARARAALPARGRVAYLSDLPLESKAGVTRYSQAFYALAPLQLAPDDGTQAVILIDAGGEDAARDLAARAGLRLDAPGADGVAVARRDGR